MIRDYTYRLSFAGHAKHQFGEVAPRSTQPAGAENAGGAHDQRSCEIRLRVEFAGQFRYGIRSQRMYRVAFHIGLSQHPVEHVVRRKVNQARIALAAGQCQIAHRERHRPKAAAGSRSATST